MKKINTHSKKAKNLKNAVQAPTDKHTETHQSNER